MFGALRGAVHADSSFFEPLPIAELNAWSPTSKKRRAPSSQKMLTVSLTAFWAIAEDLSFTAAEQCALLSVSKRTLLRWRTKVPAKSVHALDRLILILLTYVRLVDTFAHVLERDDQVLAWFVRCPGTADNPEAPDQSVLDALSERSVLAMHTHYRRMAESLDRESAERA